MPSPSLVQTVVSLIGYFFLGFYSPRLWRRKTRPEAMPDGLYFWHATLRGEAAALTTWSGVMSVANGSFDAIAQNTHEPPRTVRAGPGAPVPVDTKCVPHALNRL